jgi:hypothetical protein
MRRAVFLILIFLSLSSAKSWGGDGLWEISEGNYIKSFNGFEVTLLKIGSHSENGSIVLERATYRISRNWTALDEVALVPGESYNFSVNGTGLTRSYMVKVRLKELGFDEGIPYAETDVNSANFRYPPAPMFLSLNITPLADGAAVSWNADLSSNATLLVSSQNNTIKKIAVIEHDSSHDVLIDNLAPGTEYSLSITLCGASCNTTDTTFRTTGEPPKAMPEVMPEKTPLNEKDQPKGPDVLPLVIIAAIAVLVIILARKN